MPSFHHKDLKPPSEEVRLVAMHARAHIHMDMEERCTPDDILWFQARQTERDGSIMLACTTAADPINEIFFPLVFINIWIKAPSDSLFSFFRSYDLPGYKHCEFCNVQNCICKTCCFSMKCSKL